MSTPVLTTAFVKKLETNASNQDVSAFNNRPFPISETDLTITNFEFTGPFPSLVDYEKGDVLWENEFQNGKALFEYFMTNKAPYSLLTDECFVGYLTHVVYYDYMMKRWSPLIVQGKRDMKRRALSRFLFEKFWTRNGIVRLYWPFYLTYAPGEKDPYYYTKIALKYAGTVDKLIERSFSRNRKLFQACLEAISKLPDPSVLTSKGRSGQLGKRMNNILASISLDSLDYSEVLKIVSENVKSIAQIKDVNPEETQGTEANGPESPTEDPEAEDTGDAFQVSIDANDEGHKI
jgi:hypothetical protein